MARVSRRRRPRRDALRGLPARLGRDRVSLHGGGGAGSQSSALLRVGGAARGGGAAGGTGWGGADHERGARAGEERVARRHEREQLLSVHRLEEMSTPALDALDRARTVMLLTVSPLETHGPHLPVGVDAFAAR